MSSPGDQVINAPFSLEISRKLYLGNYETETIGLRIEFMNMTANQALAQLRGIMGPWIQQSEKAAAPYVQRGKAEISANNSNNVKPESKPSPSAAPVKGPTCNRCGAPLKQTASGKIDWAEVSPGQFAPKGLDGELHRCKR